MAYAAPTLSDFRARYPAFAAVADETVQAWLDDGDPRGVSWSDADRFAGAMLFAAHHMASQGLGVGAIAGGVTSFRSGSFSATISESAAARTGFAATSYGRDYDLILRRYYAGPISAWSPPAATDVL